MLTELNSGKVENEKNPKETRFRQSYITFCRHRDTNRGDLRCSKPLFWPNEHTFRVQPVSLSIVA